jgi:hypothetical protein
LLRMSAVSQNNRLRYYFSSHTEPKRFKEA